MVLASATRPRMGPKVKPWVLVTRDFLFEETSMVRPIFFHMTNSKAETKMWYSMLKGKRYVRLEENREQVLVVQLHTGSDSSEKEKKRFKKMC